MTLNWLNEPFQIKIIKMRQQLINLDAFIVFLCLITRWTAKNRSTPLRHKKTMLNQL